MNNNELQLVGILAGIETFVSVNGDNYAFIEDGKTVQIEKALSSNPEFWAAPNKNDEASKFDNLEEALHEAEMSKKSRMMIHVFLEGTAVIAHRLHEFNVHPFRAIDGRCVKGSEKVAVLGILVSDKA